MGTIAAQSDQIKEWLDQGLPLTRIHILLGRHGVVVSYRTLNRYATTELGFGKRRTTMRMDDREPGAQVQVDFGRLGLLTDIEGRWVVRVLVFPTSRETLNTRFVNTPNLAASSRIRHGSAVLRTSSV